MRLPYHPTRAWEGEDQKPGELDQASCPDLLRAVPDSYHALGRGWMGMDDMWRKIETCWESTSFPRAGPVGGAGADKNGHIPDKK